MYRDRNISFDTELLLTNIFRSILYYLWPGCSPLRHSSEKRNSTASTSQVYTHHLPSFYLSVIALEGLPFANPLLFNFLPTLLFKQYVEGETAKWDVRYWVGVGGVCKRTTSYSHWRPTHGIPIIKYHPPSVTLRLEIPVTPLLKFVLPLTSTVSVGQQRPGTTSKFTLNKLKAWGKYFCGLICNIYVFSIFLILSD